MYQATLRIEPGGAYGNPTTGTGASIELWCNDHCDLLQVVDDPDGQVVAAIEERVGIRDRLDDDRWTVVITEECLKAKRHTVEQYLERHGCLLVPPLRYADGAKHCRILGLDPDDLAAVYRDLADDRTVDVEAKRRVETPTVEHPLLTLESVLPTLSTRQREALLVARDLGYYEIPREATTEAIGEELGVERRTAENHLRRAENKLVDALADFVGGQPRAIPGT